MDVNYEYKKGVGWVASIKEVKFRVLFKPLIGGGGWEYIDKVYDTLEEAQQRLDYGEKNWGNYYKYQILSVYD